MSRSHRIRRLAALAAPLLAGLAPLAPAQTEVAPVAAAATAAAPAAINAGDTAWLLVSTAMVLLMTPGLACFYGGLVRRKNVLGTMMQSLAAMALMGVLWIVAGYTLAFGPDHGGFIGDLSWAFLRGVGLEPSDVYATTTPHLAFMAFQGMFAIITPALIGGAVAERMKFGAFFAFIAFWGLLVYFPLCHWVWGDGGWMLKMGALDFAGGTVVHISSGVSALVACLVLGRRREFPREPIIPHNLPLVILGGGLLWFGWFGFNAGSALAANGLAASALVATHGSAAAGALAIGLLTGLACASFVHWRTRRGIDDSLDAYGVHGIGGTVGALLTGVFAVSAVNKASGLIEGNAHQLWIQFISVVVTYVYAGVVSFGILKVIGVFGGLRVKTEDETIGLDQTQHGEEGYSF